MFRPRKLQRKAETFPGLERVKSLTLGAWDVLVLATWGCGATVMAVIIATVLTTAKLAGARLENHRESEVLVIIEVVQDRVVSLGEALFLEDLNVARTTGWKT